MKNGKKILYLSLVLLMVLLLPLVSLAAEGYGSNGKFLAPIDSPVAGSIPISNRAELEAIIINLSGNYHLTTDINLSGAEWAPIGDSSNPFAGIFDGQGYVIQNLTITGDNYYYNGLFGVVSGTGIVKNVGLENTQINVSHDGDVYAGGICGDESGFPPPSINNCYNTGNISASSSSSNASVGGICGKLSTITNCYNMGNISASSPSSSYTARVGGICGTSSSISNCYNTGNISASYAYARAGGICGYSQDINNCFNLGNISATTFFSALAGGICGDALSSVNNCYNMGDVSASSTDSSSIIVYAGGICGSDYPPINNCYNIGGITTTGTASSYAGGIFGGNFTTVDNCYCLNFYDREFGTQLTSEQMKNKANFTGWDFNTVWEISPSKNNGYPYLRDLTQVSEVNISDATQTPTATSQTATPTASTVLVNGKQVSFDAYNIGGSNYFKLRDLAYTLSGSQKQFEVGWDAAANAISLTGGKAYTAVGGEMADKGSGNQQATPTTSKIYMDGKEVQLTAYNIGGNNYFKLRDIGQAFDFGVDWDAAANTVIIDTGKGYTPD